MLAIAIACVGLLLHRAVEDMVCVGEHAAWRRYWWALGTSAALILGMFGAWAVVFSTVEWRGQYGGVTLALSPVVVVIALANAYMARLAHDEVTLAVTGADDAGDFHAKNKVNQ